MRELKSNWGQLGGQVDKGQSPLLEKTQKRPQKEAFKGQLHQKSYLLCFT